MPRLRKSPRGFEGLGFDYPDYTIDDPGFSDNPWYVDLLHTGEDVAYQWLTPRPSGTYTGPNGQPVTYPPGTTPPLRIPSTSPISTTNLLLIGGIGLLALMMLTSRGGGRR